MSDRSANRKIKSQTLATHRGKDHPHGLGSETYFADLRGVSPIETSSGKVVRHRLNSGGNLEANRALYMICLFRMRRDQRTQEYVALDAPLAKPGKSKRKIIRCLKRYLAREVYRVLVSCGTHSSPTGTKAEVYIAMGSSTT